MDSGVVDEYVGELLNELGFMISLVSHFLSICKPGLDYRFGHDGTFWMTYKDFLESYQYIDRTLLFTPEWHLATQWINYSFCPPSRGKFEVTITAENESTVIVLSKQDPRYMTGDQIYAYVLSTQPSLRIMVAYFLRNE